ncbi:MAG: ParA family protein, partial [Mycobacterium sp.]|nr:ParA family protein [Mycobacterium sp.]
GNRVLAIDLDPQVNFTKRIGYSLGVQSPDYDQQLPESTLFDMLDDPDSHPMAKCMVPLWSIPNLNLVPGDPDIHDLIDLLPTKPDGALRVRDALEDLLDSPEGDFDYVFIDCPPSKGIYPTAAMIAVDEIMAPVDLRTTDSLTGIYQLIRSFEDLPSKYQPKDGIFLVGNLFDEVGTDEADNRAALENLGLPVAKTTIKTRKAISKAQNRMNALVEQVGEQSKGAR